jgi:predicted phosphoribosyltransferase
MQAAVLALRQHAPARIVVAVPVGARETCDRMRRLADQVVCVATPEPFNAVALWYEEFSQTTDEEVRQALAATTRTLSSVPQTSRKGDALDVVADTHFA